MSVVEPKIGKTQVAFLHFLARHSQSGISVLTKPLGQGSQIRLLPLSSRVVPTLRVRVLVMAAQESTGEKVLTIGRFKIRSEEPPNAQDAASLSEAGKGEIPRVIPVASSSLPIEEEKSARGTIARDRKLPQHVSEQELHRPRSPVNARLVSISPARADKGIETSEQLTSRRISRPKAIESPLLSSDDSELLVPLQVFESFASVVSAKFSEMLTLHRDIMIEIIHKDASRDEQVVTLIRENAKLARQLTEVEMENQFARERLGKC